jgi:hypothetical protein
MKLANLTITLLILLQLLPVQLAQAQAAATLTVSAITVDNYRYGGTTAKIRIYASDSFFRADGQRVLGAPVGSGRWFQEVSCTVSGTTLSIPSFTLVITTNAMDNPNVLLTAVIVDANGLERERFYSDFSVPNNLGSVVTWAEIALFSEARRPPVEGSYTRDQTDRLLEQIQHPLASDTLLGETILSSAPADSSKPTAVGANDYAAAGHKGITALSTAPASASNPIAVSTTDPVVNDVFNLKAYGDANTCNGTNDDLPAFNAAFAAMPSTGGTLVIGDTATPCMVSDEVVINKPVVIRGENGAAPFIYNNTVGSTVSFTNHKGVIIKRLGSSTNPVIRIVNTEGVWLEHLIIDGAGVSNYPLKIDRLRNGGTLNVLVTRAAAAAMLLGSSLTGNDGSFDNTFIASTFAGPKGVELNSFDGGGTGAYHNSFLHCNIEYTNNDGLDIVRGDNNSFYSLRVGNLGAPNGNVRGVHIHGFADAQSPYNNYFFHLQSVGFVVDDNNPNGGILLGYDRANGENAPTFGTGSRATTLVDGVTGGNGEGFRTYRLFADALTNPSTKPLVAGSGSNSSLTTYGAEIDSASGSAALVVRDSNHGVDSFLYSDSGGGIVGTFTDHTFSIRTHNMDRLSFIGSVAQFNPTNISQVLLPDGTSSNPALSFDSEGAMGLYRKSASLLGVVGNLGFGSDNTFDIGPSGSKPRQVNAGTSISIAGAAALTTSAQTGTPGSIVMSNQPTIVQPTIASFASAQHDHTNAAGGGQLGEGALALTDVATNNASASKHGLLPKLSGSAADVLRGDGTFGAVPPGFKRYWALLTQSGTSVPSVTVLENGLSGTPTLARTSAGIYTITLTGAFTTNKTAVLMGPPPQPGGSTVVSFYVDYTSANVITISSKNSDPVGGTGGFTDNALNNTIICIMVWP